ncbi:efflux RND transporter periplasmic adaptor subunit [Geomonas agri]|uniref:efflux RND transporter periplasmic adaptor subunit n=1 Tax=Geomonas agri TaxID=2873702 RepID=UPI001CD7BADC|nr:efflux RND transporter periplasmic adaptor subunit [Geomonas agri]
MTSTHRLILLCRAKVLASLVSGALAGSVCLAGTASAEGPVRIQLAPAQQTTLSSEIAANVLKLPFKEGDSFRQGDLLVEFDCSLLQAQLRKTQATAEAARETLKVSERLAQLNSISSLEVDQARAKVKETDAEVAAMEVTVSKCIMKAPFSGRVAKLQADRFQYVSPGKPIMDLLDTSRLEVRMIVPSRWLSWLRPKGRFLVHIDELGRNYEARVVRVGARIDPLSQTVPVMGEIVGNHEELVSGMSGTASFAKGQK